MFCTQCGTRAPDGARFCGSCGRPLGAPAPPAQPHMAHAHPAPAPAVPAAAVQATPQSPPSGITERIIVLLRTTTARPPGKRPWHRDALVTDQRVIVWNSGMGGILGKSLAAGAAAGIGAGVLGAAGAGAGAALGSVLAGARSPGLDAGRAVSRAEVDALAAGKPEVFQAWYAQAAAVQLLKGGFLGESKLIVQTPQGPLEVWIGGWFKELLPLLQQVVGPRLVVG